MRKTILEYAWVFVVILGISGLFYPTIWRQIIEPVPDNQLVVQGESPVYEFVAETVRLNILSGKNPFAETKQVLYPMGWKYALDDVAPINGIYFVFLRPWFNAHQSMMMIILSSVIFSGITMYVLLRLLRIPILIALLSSCVLAFTPFVTERIGAHPTYVSLYLFVLPTIFLLKLTDGRIKNKWWSSILLGISLALPFVTNLYFGVMIAVLIGLSIIVYGIFLPQLVKEFFINNWRYLWLSAVVVIVSLSPWIKEVGEILWYGVVDRPSDWRDIIAYSADLTNFVIPSHFNPMYQPTVSWLGSQYAYIRTTFESFVYPGIVLVMGMFGYLFFSKKLPKYLRPMFVMACIFGILTLGPYLQIGGNVTSIPLPYTLISYIPLIQMARAPARFIAVFIFLSVIILAHVLNFLIKNKINKIWQLSFIIVLFSTFYFDQRGVIGPPAHISLPIKIYKYLAENPNSSPLLEIPFTMRDSIKYFGFQHSHYASYVSLIHGQPIFGIYAGRIPNHVMNYYTNNPLFSPIAQIIDSETKNLSSKPYSISYEAMKNAIDFYQIRYVVTKDDEKYSNEVVQIFENLGFDKKMNDLEYILWERQPSITMVDSFDNQGVFDQLMLTRGWSKKEDGESGRWAMGKEAEVILKLVDDKKSKFIIEGETIVEPQIVRVWINQKYIGKITVGGTGYTRHSLPLNNYLKIGTNIITMRFANTHVLAKIIPDSKDLRPLALHVKYLGLE